MKQKRLKLHNNVFIHSDQGGHYTSPGDNPCLDAVTVGIMHPRSLANPLLNEDVKLIAISIITTITDSNGD
ncbi:hypothetical protein D3C76_130590 [compost metagenome]